MFELTKHNYLDLYTSFGNKFEYQITIEQGEQYQVQDILLVSDNSVYCEDLEYYYQYLLTEGMLDIEPVSKGVYVDIQNKTIHAVDRKVKFVYQKESKTLQQYKLPIIPKSQFFVSQESGTVYIKKIVNNNTLTYVPYEDSTYTNINTDLLYITSFYYLLNTPYFTSEQNSTIQLGQYEYDMCQKKSRTDLFQLIRNSKITDYLQLPQTFNFKYELVEETDLNKYKNPIVTSVVNKYNIPLFYKDTKTYQLQKPISQRSLNDLMSNGVELTTFNGQIIGKDQYMFEVMFDYQTNTLSYDIYTNLVNQPIMQHLNIVEDEIHEGLSLYPVQYCEINGTDYVTTEKYVKENDVIHSIRLIGTDSYEDQNQLVQCRYRNNGKFLNVTTQPQFNISTQAYKVDDRVYKVNQFGITHIDLDGIVQYNQHNGFIKTEQDLGQKINITLTIDLNPYNQMLLQSDGISKDARLYLLVQYTYQNEYSVILYNMFNETFVLYENHTLEQPEQNTELTFYGYQKLKFNGDKLFVNELPEGQIKYWTDSLVDAIGGTTPEGFGEGIPGTLYQLTTSLYITTSGSIKTKNESDVMDEMLISIITVTDFDYLPVYTKNNPDYTRNETLIPETSLLHQLIDIDTKVY